jgi:hypothetical protein
MTSSNEEKDRVFTECLSYELDLFIKKKDPEYFNRVVKPYLQCKMEKNFMDYYLIEDRNHILDYANLGRVEELNSLEKCLLIDFLISSEDNQQA